MFHCLEEFCEYLYYSKRHDCVCIMKTEHTLMICSNVFGSTEVSLWQLLCELASENITTVRLGFTLFDVSSFQACEHKELLFVLYGSKSIFEMDHLMMPLLSYT